MDGQRTLEIVVTTWGVMMAVSPGLQIRQMLRTQQSEDVSVGYFAVLSVGFVLWAIYGVAIDSWVLYVCNTIATVFGVATIIIARRLRARAAA
jgi:uncharacterized protein with PQ loop repeat